MNVKETNAFAPALTGIVSKQPASRQLMTHNLTSMRAIVVHLKMPEMAGDRIKEEDDEDERPSAGVFLRRLKSYGYIGAVVGILVMRKQRNVKQR